MFKKLIVAALAMASVNAFAVSGKVVNSNGFTVENAKIEVNGTSNVYFTDEEGMFDIPLDNVDEIHVEAEGFSHKVLHLHRETSDSLTIVLSRSVIEVVDVKGIPLHASKIASAQPISVIAGDELRQKQASTLGETLKNEVGVQSNYYAGVASSPIIRGLGGPRVLIAQNGLDVGDASRVGPDHVVSTEASTAEQIEILRGPATLFYGSGAIGGVVNIVDDRVPLDSSPIGAVATEYNSVNDEALISGAYTGGTERFAFHVDGFVRDGSDYDIPGIAVLETEEEHEEEEHEEHVEGTLENSASESSGFNIGSSLLLDNGYVGISYGKLERLNGIPGHGHGEEHHEEEEEGHEEEEEHGEEVVLSDMVQDRWQLHSDLTIGGDIIAAINTRIGYTNYQHQEIHIEGEHEEGEEEHEEHENGTVFKNKTVQARVDFILEEFSGWQGAVSIETRQSDFEAIGEEAFTPPSKTEAWALALIQEKHKGNVLWQLGARIEQVTLNADDIVFHHDEDHDHNEEGEEEHEEELVQFDTLDFVPVSISAGLVWDYAPGYNFGLSVAHAERAPSASELFSAGPHLATRSYEAGALFKIHEEDGALHLEYEGNAEKEVSSNIDLTLRKFEGNVGFVFNVFYNNISDFYYQIDTELMTENIFPEDEEEIEDEEEEHHHAENLPVYIFTQGDTTFYGLEMEVVWQINRHAKWTFWGDSVRGELDSGEDLPRIPPARLGAYLDLNFGGWDFQLSAAHYFDQNRVATNETTTDGYTMLDAGASYSFPAFNGEGTFFINGSNLTNEDARIHSSFLKNQAPLPGRNIKIGLRATF